MSWLLGLALGVIAGGAVAEAGVLALLLLVPAVVWAAREKDRPIGMGGLCIGAGAGMAGLVMLANIQCAGQNVSGPDFFRECLAPDLTAWFAAASALAAIGVLVSVLAARSTRSPTP